MAITLGGQLGALLYRNCLLQAKQIKTNIFQLLFPILCMIVVISLNSMIKGLASNNANGSSQDPSIYEVYWNNLNNASQVRNGIYWYSNPVNGPPISPNETYPTTGLLSYIPTLNQTYYNSSGQFNSIKMPRFQQHIGADMDSDLVNFVQSTKDKLKKVYNFNLTLAPPSSNFYINSYDPINSKIGYTLEYLTEAFLYSDYSNQIFGWVNDGRFQPINLITNALLKQNNGTKFFINTGNDSFFLSNSFDNNIITYLVAIFMLPSIFTFIFPVFVHSLVFEKQEKLFQVMSMMGLKNYVYTLANQFFYIILYLFIMIIMCVMGFAADLAFFTQLPGKMILLIFLYGFSLVSFAFLFSSFFWKAKTSAIISYLLVILTPTIGTVIDLFALQGKAAPLPLLFYPPFAFVHGLNLIFMQLNGYGKFDYLTDLSSYSQFSVVLVALFIETIVFYILGIYLNNVLPKEFGISYSPFYPIYELRDLFKKPKSGELDESTSLLNSNAQSINITVADQSDIIEEDADCKREREKANSNEEYLLKIINVKKVYKTKGVVKEALTNFCLTSTKGEVLGLLGKNGAGKSTLIHIIGGMYSPTSGDILINGYSILDKMEKIYEFLGFCSQHDILYQDLTIYQHLKFYCRLKGLFNSNYEIEEHIKYILEKVKLWEDKSKKISQLSGGMKRRVSIAISIMGNNKLVLLDEPSTGLDPDSRRAVWDIIESVKQDKTILITTHNMEEADALCSNIAIVNDGVLQCVGSPMYLKNRFGQGFKIDIVPSSDSHRQPLMDLIRQSLPNAVEQESMNDTISFLISRDNDISSLFDIIATQKESLGIKEWGVSQTSLEEVFMKMVDSADGAQS